MEVDKEPSSTQSEGVGTSESDHASKDEPEVDEQTRLWRTVGEDPSDFTSWTSLLQKVEQKVLSNKPCTYALALLLFVAKPACETTPYLV